jgi:hypothetical protein
MTHWELPRWKERTGGMGKKNKRFLYIHPLPRELTR